jgi:molybdopterin-containing oxidoreductase family membrane subunit
LILNFIGGFYYLYKKYTGEPLNNKFYLPVIYVSIVWALSIHTVTAFLLNTMPSRPMWHHSMMPIRFISTAFAAGPSLIILIFLIVRTRTRLWIDNSAIDLLATIVTYCLGVAIFLTLSEVVTSLYANTEHALGLYYLMFGKHGFTDLVPWFWGSVLANIVAFVILLTPYRRTNYRLLALACVLAFGGIWVEKGMGLLVPGFIPTPIGEFTQYFPTTLEIFVSLGNWAVGLLVLTVLLKGAIGILLGDVAYAAATPSKSASSSAGALVAPELL